MDDINRDEETDIIVPQILPPSDDGVFKTLLTHPDAAASLRDVVACFTGISVKKIAVRNAELPITDIYEKQERFDVSCETEDGEQVDIEMQAAAMVGDNAFNKHINLKSRCIFYACNLHTGQKGRGKKYADMARTFQITFCGFTVFEGREDCFNRFSFRNEEGEVLLDDVNIIFVELSKLGGVLKKPVKEMSGAEMWSVFLAYANDPKYRVKLDEIISVREEIKMANSILNGISRDEDERARFRARRKFQMDMEHNKAASFMMGKDEGIEEGIEKGKLEDAKNMLADGISVEKAAEYTGLPLETIENLLKDK